MSESIYRAVLLVVLGATGCTEDASHAATRDATSESHDAACALPEHLDVGAPDGAAPCGDVPQTILRENCVGGICHHAGPNPAGPMNLLSRCVADRLVGVSSSCNGRLLIDPVEPAQSFILEKLEKDMPECGGARMPFQSQLPDPQIECVKRWVYAVAAAARR